MTAADVITGTATWSCEAADCLDWLRTLPDESVDLLMTSPPYLEARTYGIAAGRKLDEWVAWMVAVVKAAAPKVKGLIAIVCEGQTRSYRYLPAPFLLMADLHRAGFNLRKPPVFHRVGIPGSGGPDWLRNDWEPIVCITRKGKLSWSDNTACGHPPKWAPGGEMSYRQSDGTRVNQWGAVGGKNGGGKRFTSKAERPSHILVNGNGKTKKAPPKFGDSNGDLDKRDNLSRKERGELRRKAVAEGRGHKIKQIDSGEYADSETEYEWNYVPPVLANPGNVIRANVGGGQMGHALAHEN